VGKAGAASTESAGAFSVDDILATLRANWINGVAKADQKAAAKSLIRMCLTTTNVPSLAAAIGANPDVLTQLVQNIEKGAPLTATDLNLLGRFDAIVSAKLDAGYERGDQRYRNWAKVSAAVVAIVLAAIGGGVVAGSSSDYWSWNSGRLLLSILVGAVSTPLAPMAKDVSTTLVAAVSAITAARR